MASRVLALQSRHRAPHCRNPPGRMSFPLCFVAFGPPWLVFAAFLVRGSRHWPTQSFICLPCSIHLFMRSCRVDWSRLNATSTECITKATDTAIIWLWNKVLAV